MGFTIGQRVADYEIVSLLGTGGMGRVYRVRNVISHRTEAMKVLLADLTAEPDLAARFAGEIRTLAGLDHPNIAQLHTALQTGNELVMVMEFVDGATLQQLARQAPLPLEKVVDYMHQVLAALNFAHNRGVVHRDIKPANIMVTPEGMVKLTDFGIAKTKSRLEDELTRPGTTVGSLYYMSPEQAHGGGDVDGRSDIYSVGISMYELLAGRRPFEDESAYVVLHSQLHVAPRPPIELNPLLSRPLSDLILKTLEKDPAKRFQSAAAFSNALRLVTGIAPSTMIEGGAPVIPAIAAAAAARPSSRRGIWIAAETCVMMSLVGATAFGVPRLLRMGAVAKTIGHVTNHSPALPAAPHTLAAAGGSAQSVATTVAKPVAVASNDSDLATVGALSPGSAPSAASLHPSSPPPSAVAEAPAKTDPAPIFPVPQMRVTQFASSAHGRSAVVPRLSRVAYQPASLPDERQKSEQDVIPAAAPSLSPTTLAELQEVRTQKAQLDIRAAVVRGTVQRLKSAQEANGDGLSQYVAGAYVRMNAYLGAEKTDLDDGDVASARDHMHKAEYEVGILENMFSK